MVQITSNIGASVFVDGDPVSSESNAGWIWIQRADGSRTLLNLYLVALGSARVHELAENSAFSDWMMATSEQVIQQGEDLCRRAAARIPRLRTASSGQPPATRERLAEQSIAGQPAIFVA
jgi:hypothetical protein